MDSKKTNDNENQLNDFQQIKKHGDYRVGDSDSEYPAAQEEDIERAYRERRVQEGVDYEESKKENDFDDNNTTTSDSTRNFLEDDDSNDDFRGLTRESL